MYKEIKKDKRKKGFTLVELVIVVLIIGVISGISMPMYFSAVEKSRASESLHVLGTIAKAQQRHKLQSNEYTDTIDELDITLKDYSTGTNAIGSEFDTEFFDFTLGEDSATAERKEGDYTLGVDYITSKLSCTPNTNKICAGLGLEGEENFSTENSEQEVVKGPMEACPANLLDHDGGPHMAGVNMMMAGRGGSCQYRVNSDGSYDVFTCEMRCRLYSYYKNGMYKGMTDCWGGYDSNYNCINGEGWQETTENVYDENGHISYCVGEYSHKMCSSASGLIYDAGIIYTTDGDGHIISETFCKSVNENGVCNEPTGEVYNYQYDIYGNIKEIGHCDRFGRCSNEKFTYNEQSVKTETVYCSEIGNHECTKNIYTLDSNGYVIMSRSCTLVNGECNYYYVEDGIQGLQAEVFSYDDNGNRTSFGQVNVDSNGNPVGDVRINEVYEYLDDGSYIRKTCNYYTSINGNCDVQGCIKYSLDGNTSHCE